MRTLPLLFLACLAPSLPSAAAQLAGEKDTPSQAPVYVPLDSWVYPAFNRLSSLGYVPDLEHLVAPWPRTVCLELLKEAEDFSSRHDVKVSSPAINSEALKLISDLEYEFAPDAESGRMQLRMESLYSKLLPIAGAPMNDSYHFGQTINDNYGRPYGQGFNSATGFSGFFTAGVFSAYVRAELQTAGSNADYTANTKRTLAAVDGVPGLSIHNRQSGVTMNALDSYVGVHFAGFNATVGKQSAWWGPGTGSAFAFSNNSVPLYSLQLSQQTPFVLPWLFRYLGHIRTDFLVGRLTGNASPPKPWINAQKITLQLTENLEVGFTRSSIFGGVGHPLTLGSVARSFFSTNTSGGNAFGSSNDPGDRRSGFDFWWRVPGLRRFVTLYSDSLADDESNPLASPHRSAWGPGIYFPHFFHPQLDLRLETYSTWLYRGDEGGRFIYWNTQYRDAYTNSGNLIGSWVGRDARAYSVSATYWRSARDKFTMSYQQNKIGGNFIPGGGTQTDLALSWQAAFHRDTLINLFSQWERLYIPLLGGPRTDFASGLTLTYAPHSWGLKR